MHPIILYKILLHISAQIKNIQYSLQLNRKIIEQESSQVKNKYTNLIKFISIQKEEEL